jgi:hypothetical protein
MQILQISFFPRQILFPIGGWKAYFLRLSAVGLVASLCMSGHVSAQNNGPDPSLRATFERVYVPAYSQVLTQAGRSQPLATTMVIHNVDPDTEIEITLVNYFDRSGAKVKEFLDEPMVLGPFESQSFLVPIDEQAGGFGANYVVEWASEDPALPPAVEAVMIGGSGTQGISCTALGRVIERRP